MSLRVKTAGLIILTIFLVAAVISIGQVYEIQRISADLLQLAQTKEIQPNFLNTDEITLFINDNVEKARPTQRVIYTFGYKAKKEIKNARLVAALGNTTGSVYPEYSWELGDLKPGTSGQFSIPVTIKIGESPYIVSRVTLSKMAKLKWWEKEKRIIIGTVDDIDWLEH